MLVYGSKSGYYVSRFGVFAVIMLAVMVWVILEPD
jgi:hypothetical protein